MHPTLRNVLAIIGGLLIGGTINSLIISISGKIIPPPAGFDLTTVEGLQGAMAQMTPKHFLFPFLAHALGTFVGAYIATRFSASFKMGAAIIISTLNFVGGFMMVMMVPSPTWFTVVDLGLAYFPMGLLAYRMNRNV